MTTPLILQIQEAALDSNASVTDALRKAKIACVKLGLTEFGHWIDLEFNGYMGKTVDGLPYYRKVAGIPEVYNPYHGWRPLQFASAKMAENLSVAPIGMTIFAIEDSLRDVKNTAMFEFPYPPEVANKIRHAIGDELLVRIKIPVPAVANILHVVRNILLEWTLEMEKQGVLGEGLMFSQEERIKSAMATAATVNHIQIGQVGAFVQSAENTVVQGGVDATLNLTNGVRDLVQQVEQLLPAANLPSQTQQDTCKVLDELKEVSASANPDTGRLRKGLASLKRALAPAGEHLVRIAVDAAVTKLLGPGS